MTPLLLIVLLLLITYKFYKSVTDKPPGTPPGLPVVGAYWYLLWGNYKFPYKTLDYYTKKLRSKVISCYFGKYFIVIANDYASVKEVTSRKEFDGRLSEIHVLKARAFNKKLGIFFIEGEQWKEQRRFALRHMRDFGFGRRQDAYEAEVMSELNVLMDFLKNGPINEDEKIIYKNGMALFPDILYSTAVNNIWYIMFGYRFDRTEHDKLRYFARQGISFQRSGDTMGGAISYWPTLKYFGNLFNYKNIIKYSYTMIDFVKKYLEEHKSMYQEANERGFISRYVHKLNQNNNSTFFSEEQLIMTLIDFMFPAITAVPSVLTFAIKFMIHYPEIATKVRNEIHRTIGTGRLVNWSDRNSLPYTEAVLRETMRYETLTPMSVFHKSTEDTMLQGYFIPAGTAVATNLAGMNHDLEFWGDPENFRPERFLKDNGELDKDYTLPFGLGHRVCAGETFARFSLFGTFAVLMQNFDFSFVQGQPNGLNDKFPGLIITPKETWIRMELCPK